MALFRRNRGSADDEVLEDELTDVATVDGELSQTPQPGSEAVAAPPSGGSDPGFTVRVDGVEELTPIVLPPGGPWDAFDAPQDDLPRLDLGALRVPIVEGIELNIEASSENGVVTGVSYGIPNVGMMQISAFAAPRSSGIWAEVREEIAQSAGAAGGTLSEHPGPLGIELRGQVPTDQPGQYTPARFIGVDGPRWFARAVISGQPAVEDEMGEAMLGLFRMCVVVRGDEAMPVRDLLPLTMPREVQEAAEQAAEAAKTSADFNPFERGPEITERR